MPNPNAVVGLPTRVEGDSFELDGRRLRLGPEEARRRVVLEGVARQGMPLYVEIDPATSTVARMFIPLVARVSGIAEQADGLAIEFDASHAIHHLRRNAPDFELFQRQLRASLDNLNVLIVTEDDARNIIDVRGFRPGPDGPLPPLPPFPPRPGPKWPWPLGWLREWLLRFWKWPFWPWWWFRFGCMSAAYAQQVFNQMAATNCAPLTVPAPCIPFMYPDNYCWARAHEMCRLMLQMNITPGKVWINYAPPGWLKADTRNHPNCYIEWSWHVAPTICVRRWPWFFLWSQEMVIDPSLTTTPVTKAQWKALMNNVNATLTDTSWTNYWQSGGTDPTFTQTAQHLDTARLLLQARAMAPAGPPPYAHCP